MQCPECAASLHLAEPPPATLVDKYALVTCIRCAKPVVATVVADEIRLLSGLEAMRAGREQVKGKQVADLIVTAIMTVGGIAFALVGAVWQFLTPASLDGGTTDTMSALVVLVMLLAFALLPAVCFLLDLWLGTRAWRRSLPRVSLAFVVEPEGYRA